MLYPEHYGWTVQTVTPLRVVTVLKTHQNCKCATYTLHIFTVVCIGHFLFVSIFYNYKYKCCNPEYYDWTVQTVTPLRLVTVYENTPKFILVIICMFQLFITLLLDNIYCNTANAAS